MFNLCEWHEISDQSWERERERGKDICACFLSSGWEVFFGRRERRKQKAAGEGEQLAKANPPFHIETGDNGGHWSICFYLSFFVLFFPHRATGRCFTFSFACSLGPLSSHLFRHLPGQQFPLFMSQTKREREAERQRKREIERGGGFFFCPFYPLPPPPSFILSSLFIAITSSPFYPCATHAPSSLHRLPPPPPPPYHSTHCPPVTLATFWIHQCFNYFTLKKL